MPTPKNILVIRFSSMGDVAMTVPVIKTVLQQYPALQITVVSNAFLQPLFEGLERCNFYPALLKEQHHGAAGIFRLYKELKRQQKFDAIVDLHSVLRSRLLTLLFKTKGFKIATIDKGRAEKKALTRTAHKVFRQLTSTHERYSAVFRKIGLPVQLNNKEPVYSKKPVPVALQIVFSSGKKIIGVAPFAQYTEKMYPIAKMKQVVEKLAAGNNTVLLFGGGKKEAGILQQWEEDIFSVFNIAGKYSFDDELAIISNVDSMVSMDSANMHLASLFNVPVVSVWGATHTFAGFYGWGQDEKDIVQTNLYCRPCSVFGNKPCYRGDNACMNSIGEEVILNKINGL
ncbi:MAG: glycosyltransferase family 9 protein [Ferruginibacter sp.]|nr:glycosyltransferase family 9 protein [Ferruginibacter sp.]